MTDLTAPAPLLDGEAPICTQEIARAAGLDVAPSPAELTAIAASIVRTWGDRSADLDDETASTADAGAQLARAVPLLLARLERVTADRDGWWAAATRAEEQHGRRAERAEATIARVRALATELENEKTDGPAFSYQGGRVDGAYKAAVRIRTSLDTPPAEQPPPTTYAEAQQRHIQVLRRRRAARQAMDDAWDRIEEAAIRDLVRLATAEHTST